MTGEVKSRIRQAFDRAELTYDLNDYFQRNVCLKCIEALGRRKKSYDVVADFACVTGNSTLALADHIKYRKIFAINFSEGLVSIAKKKCENRSIDVVLSDYDQKIFHEKIFDLVFCNMGLQWSLNIRKTLELFTSYLNENGIIVFSMPFQGTVKELESGYQNCFHSARLIKSILKELNLVTIEYNHIEYPQQYVSHLDALKSLKAVGANCLIRPDKNLGVDRIRRRAKDFFIKSEATKLTYQIGIFIASKSECSK